MILPDTCMLISNTFHTTMLQKTDALYSLLITHPPQLRFLNHDCCYCGRDFSIRDSKSHLFLYPLQGHKITTTEQLHFPLPIHISSQDPLQSMSLTVPVKLHPKMRSGYRCYISSSGGLSDRIRSSTLGSTFSSLFFHCLWAPFHCRQ